MPKHAPFGRVLSYKRIKTMQGRDVLAVSRCLHRNHYRAWDPTFQYGWRMRDNVELFQRRHNQSPDGVYDEPVHAYLAPLFDDYERWLYTHADVPNPEPGQTATDRLMMAIWSLYAQRPWHYHAVRPFLLYPRGQHIKFTFDCSWLITQAFFMAGLPDPNGADYKGGYGNTETLRAHGTEIATAIPGALAFYGYYGDAGNPAHVAMCVANGNCIGFGSEGGPRLLPLNYRPLRELRRYV